VDASEFLQEPNSNLVKENLQVITPKLEIDFEDIRWLMKKERRRSTHDS
jgi:hypothetical protein